MVASGGALRRRGRLQDLGLGDWLDVDYLIECVHGSCVEIIRQIIDALLQVLISFIEKILLRATLSIISG